MFLKKIEKWLVNKLRDRYNLIPRDDVIISQELLTYHIYGIDFPSQYAHIKVENKYKSAWMTDSQKEKEAIVKFKGKSPYEVDIISITIKD